MNREEINKLQIYLRNTLKNNNISIIPRADKTEDSAEFHINNEFQSNPAQQTTGIVQSNRVPSRPSHPSCPVTSRPVTSCPFRPAPSQMSSPG